MRSSCATFPNGFERLAHHSASECVVNPFGGGVAVSWSPDESSGTALRGSASSTDAQTMLRTRLRPRFESRTPSNSTRNCRISYYIVRPLSSVLVTQVDSKAETEREDTVLSTRGNAMLVQLSWRVKQTGRPTSSTGRTSGCLTTICPLLNWVTDSLNSLGTYTS